MRQQKREQKDRKPTQEKREEGGKPTEKAKPQCCCVTGARLNTDGRFEGGQNYLNSYPHLRPRRRATRGSFDTGGSIEFADNNYPGYTYYGYNVQFVGTYVMAFSPNRKGGDCTFSQSFQTLQTDFPGESVDTAPREDFQGHDTTRPPVRHPIGSSMWGIIDLPAYPLRPGGSVRIRKRFVSCINSAPPPCECTYRRCCITWTWELHIVSDVVRINRIMMEEPRCQ